MCSTWLQGYVTAVWRLKTMKIFSCAASILKNARRSLFIDISDINSSFKNLPSHLKVELLLFGDSKLSAIDNNLILKASIKYIMTTNRFSVPLFWYCFLSLALDIYIHFYSSGVHSLPTLFSLFYLREQWDNVYTVIISVVA